MTDKFEELKTQLRIELEGKIKNQIKKIKCLECELEKCSTWKEAFHEGELLKANYGILKKGMAAITLLDWETNQEIQISLNPKKTSQEQLSVKFKKAKKMESGLASVALLLQESLQKLSYLEDKMCQLEKAEDLSEFKPKKILPAKKNVPEKALPYKEFTSRAGIKILVGKNAKANDKLTFVYANGSDWWLHVQDFPGSHVVIKSADPDQETLEEAMQLALKYSKAKDRGEGEICLTQRKYVTRLPRHPGKVQVSKHKTVVIRRATADSP